MINQKLKCCYSILVFILHLYLFHDSVQIIDQNALKNEGFV
jgi:hypothetical protein